MTSFEIPLTADPQSFKIELGGSKYTLTVHWCSAAECWILDVADEAGTPIVFGIPLVTGSDLLEPFGYLGFEGKLYCQTNGDLNAVPTIDNLGTGSHLFWVTP